MVIDNDMTEIICDLEYLIGSETYNPNSYDGWNCIEGCSFRYPVNFCKNEEDFENETLTKTKSKIKYIDSDCINTMKYKFGSNHLYIGCGIVKVLEFLEKRYHLDFNQLEKKYTLERKAKMLELDEKLAVNESVKIPAGIWIAGIDIQPGNYIIMSENYKYISLDILDEKKVPIKNIFTSEREVCFKLNQSNILSTNKEYFLKKRNAGFD